MISNLKYDPKIGYTTPDEIRENLVAQCWGAADFVYDELKKAEILATIFYLAKGNPPIQTHATTMYELDDKWYWFEWAWGSHEGIHGPYESQADVKAYIIEKFDQAYGSVDVVKLHHGKIGRKGISDNDYLKRAAGK